MTIRMPWENPYWVIEEHRIAEISNKIGDILGIEDLMPNYTLDRENHIYAIKIACATAEKTEEKYKKVKEVLGDKIYRIDTHKKTRLTIAFKVDMAGVYR